MTLSTTFGGTSTSSGMAEFIVVVMFVPEKKIEAEAEGAAASVNLIPGKQYCGGDGLKISVTVR